MNKLKFIVISFLSVFFLGTAVVVGADTIPGTNYEVISDLSIKDVSSNIVYEFYSTDLRDDFIMANSQYQSRSNGVADYRKIFVSSTRQSYTTGPISATVYGGQAGASVTSQANVSFTVPKTNIGVNIGGSVTHNVPPRTYGYIVGKSSYNLNKYNLQVRYLGTNNYVSAGVAYDVSNVSTWTALHTWR